MNRRAALVLLAAGLAIAGLLLGAPDALAQQSGNDVGQNLGDLLKRYASQIYGGIVAIVSLVFLLNRRYTELGLFFIAAVLVAWLVFSPDQVADAARGIGNQVLP